MAYVSIHYACNCGSNHTATTCLVQKDEYDIDVGPHSHVVIEFPDICPHCWIRRLPEQQPEPGRIQTPNQNLGFHRKATLEIDSGFEESCSRKKGGKHMRSHRLETKHGPEKGLDDMQ